MTTTTAPAQAAEQDQHQEVPTPLGVLLTRRPELGRLAQAGVHRFNATLESA